MNRLLILFFISLLVSCSNSGDNEKLEAEISQLKTKLDECQNGADKLLAKMRMDYDSSYYENAKIIYSRLKDKHPESSEFLVADSLYQNIKRKEKEEEAAAAKLIEEEKAKRLVALNKLRIKEDDIQGIIWYKNPYFTHYANRNLTSIYMGATEDTKFLNLMMSYAGDDWIFFEKAYLSYEGNTWEIPFNEYREQERDNGSGGVWEWIEIRVPENKIDFLEHLAQSDDAKMRLTGKYTKTRNLSRNEKKAISDIINGYKALDEQSK